MDGEEGYKGGCREMEGMGCNERKKMERKKMKKVMVEGITVNP